MNEVDLTQRKATFDFLEGRARLDPTVRTILGPAYEQALPRRLVKLLLAVAWICGRVIRASKRRALQ